MYIFENDSSASNDSVLDSDVELDSNSDSDLILGLNYFSSSEANSGSNFGYTSSYYQNKYRSKKYQWLPSELQVTGGKVKILSYINNLHPENHADMYSAIESIAEQFIPLFNDCLTEPCNENMKPYRIDPDSYFNESYEEYVDRKIKEIQDSYSEQPQRNDTDGTDEKDPNFDTEINEIEDKYYDSYHEEKIVEEPKNYFFSPDKICADKVRVDLSNSRIQVIVKLANIILTPENPKYEGGSWHVEGMQNENIVCTGIYYYDQENVTPSSLAFRIGVEEPEYEQDDRMYVSEVFGFEDEEVLTQYLGRVDTLHDRCLVFPNIYQHQIQPFELQDKPAIGFRKILCFFLVDPNHRIYSTANIPPQQMDWFKSEVNKSQHKLSQIPGPVSEKVFRSLEWPLDTKEAKRHRIELMKESSM